MRQQQVYFNHVVTGCPALRTFDIHNVWDRPLLFEMGADTSEIQVLSARQIGSVFVFQPTVSSSASGTGTELTGLVYFVGFTSVHNACTRTSVLFSGVAEAKHLACLSPISFMWCNPYELSLSVVL